MSRRSALRRILTGLALVAAVVFGTAVPSGAAPAAGSAAAQAAVKGSQADLAVTKTDSPDPVSPGGTLTYTIVVTNKGPKTATSVAMDDTVPSGTTFSSISVPSAWSCTTPAVGGTGKVHCTTGSMSNGQSATITLVAKVNSTVAAGTVLSNTAHVSAATSDSKTGNNAATAKTTVQTAADLSITKTANPSPAIAGTPLTYTIEVHNLGPGTATTVKMTDTIPSGEAFQQVSAPSGWSCTPPAVEASGTLTCTKTQMLNDEQATFTTAVMVAASTPGGTRYTNTASVSAATTDDVSTNNSATVQTLVVRHADLSVTKNGSPHRVRAGHRITYAITVRNDGPSEAKKPKVVDFVGDHTVFRRVIAPADWSCSHPRRGDTGKVRCTHLGGFGPGEIDVITIVVRVKGGTTPGTLVSNTVHVSSPSPDVNQGNNASTARTRVRHT